MTHTLDSYGGTTQLKGESTGWFHLEELGGQPGLVDAVREANKEIYERATDPYRSSEIAELDENLCRVRDEVHKHIR